MMNEQDEVLFSQLADGEIDSDRLNELLLKVLDDPQGRERLREMLRLRQTTAAWRHSRPERPVIVAHGAKMPQHVRFPWHLGSLAAAAVIGGMLVFGGFWAANRFQRPGGETSRASVTAEQMQQVAKVFALHESVAGPLAWYASDDHNIKLANASAAEARNAPIAVLLRLGPASAGGASRTYIIVCREKEPALIELPGSSPDAPGLRAYLTPYSVNGKIDMQYVIALDGSEGQQGVLASMTGQRRVGLAERSLGQLTLGDRLVNVEASAWTISTEDRQ